MIELTTEQINALLEGLGEERNKAQEEVDALLRNSDDGQIDDEEGDDKSWGQIVDEHIQASHKKWSDSFDDVIKSLKPCPYCGSTDVTLLWECPSAAYCKNCCMQGPRFDKEEDSVDAWNELPRR